MAMSQVFLLHGFIEFVPGLLNLLSRNEILLPGDTSPPATSLALLGGELWSYSIICLGLAFLLVAHAPDSDRGKQVIGISGLLYHSLVGWSAVSRAWKGWTFDAGNRHIGGMIVHGALALWFLMWLVNAKKASSKLKKLMQQ